MPPKTSASVPIPWDDEMTECFLNLIIVKGVHLHKGTTKGTDLWIEVHNSLFSQPEYENLKPRLTQHDDKGRIDTRRLKDRLDTLKKKVSATKAHGNTSGFEGDLSNIFKLVEQIMSEEDEQAELAAAKKSAEADKKHKLESNEEIVLRGEKKKKKTKELESGSSASPSTTPATSGRNSS